MIPVIRRAFELRASDATYKEIQDATHLYRSKNCYPTFFSNRLYIGELVFGSLVIEDYCEPIIDQDTWQRVQAIQQAHSAAHANKQMAPANQHPLQVSSSYLLSGLLHCAICGSPMSGHLVVKNIRGDRKSWSYYFCNRRNRHYDCSALEIPRETIETAVLTELREHILQPDNLALIQNENCSVGIRKARQFVPAWAETMTSQELCWALYNTYNFTSMVGGPGGE